jgi:hypothetical protein
LSFVVDVDIADDFGGKVLVGIDALLLGDEVDAFDV